jgi:O-antigen/teichoic acid export membrane protein
MSLFKNYILNLTATFVNIASTLVTIPYITRVFTPEDLGTGAYTASIAKWFAICAGLGTAIYATKAISGVDDKSKATIFQEIFILNLISHIIFILIFYSWSLSQSELQTLLWIQGLILFTQIIDISWYFQGIQNFRIGLIRNIITKVLSLSLIFGFVTTADDLELYFLIQGVSTIISWAWTYNYWPKISLIINIPRLKHHLLASIRVFIPIFAIGIYTTFDKILLNHLHSSQAVGIFDMFHKIVTLLMVFSLAASGVLLPKFTQILANKDITKFRSGIILSYDFSNTISYIIFICLSIWGTLIASSFLGHEFSEVGKLISYGSLIVFFISWSSISTFQVMIPNNIEIKLTQSVYISAAANIILCITLMPRFGAMGAVIAWSVTEFINAVCQLRFSRKLVDSQKIIKLALTYLPLIIAQLFYQELTISSIDSIANAVTETFITISISILWLIGLYYVNSGNLPLIQTLKKMQKKQTSDTL